jgi:hypothetical protein
MTNCPGNTIITGFVLSKEIQIFIFSFFVDHIRSYFALNYFSDAMYICINYFNFSTFILPCPPKKTGRGILGHSSN